MSPILKQMHHVLRPSFPKLNRRWNVSNLKASNWQMPKQLLKVSATKPPHCSITSRQQLQQPVPPPKSVANCAHFVLQLNRPILKIVVCRLACRLCPSATGDMPPRSSGFVMNAREHKQLKSRSLMKSLKPNHDDCRLKPNLKQQYRLAMQLLPNLLVGRPEVRHCSWRSTVPVHAPAPKS